MKNEEYNINNENEILEELFWEIIATLEEKNHPDIAYFINWYQNTTYIDELEFAEFSESYKGEDNYE